MSQQAKSILSLSIPCTGVLTQYRGVTYAGLTVATAGAKSIGVAERPTTVIGEIGAVTAKGTAICEAGAAITVGTAVTYDSVGRVVAATQLQINTGAVAVTSSAANGAGTIIGGDLPQFIVGTALQAASAAGDLIEVLLS